MKFRPLTPSDYASLKPFFVGQRHALCSYSLSSIIAWTNETYRPYGAIHDDSLLVYATFARRKERSHLILPISPGREHTPEELASISRQTGYGVYWFVPGDYLERHDKKGLEKLFVIERQEGYDDYVYRTEDMATLAGNRYSKKRNLIKQFEQNYSEKVGDVSIKTISPEDVPGCLEFLERWCEERDCDVDKDEDLACEWDATTNALKNIDTLGFRSIMLSIDGTTQAFGIASQLTETTSALHFQKASAQFKGLYQFFDRECARRLFPELEYINKESDMGLPGLAQTKHSYHPVMMVKSYTLSLKEQI
ncbi:MAG: phosphatidylglycerol lysyltransferase domain-containing protein [Syntrophales bacterium]|nr:phosphatidylglycerol lysyltransferase domain-containing protein [Syntrophales bacterium]